MRTAVLAVAAATALAAGTQGQAAPQDTPAPAAASPSPAPSPSASPSTAPIARASAGPDGFVIESEDGDFRLRIRGYLQFDGRFHPGTAHSESSADTFLLRRVRPILQGTVGRYFSFNLTPDFGGGNAVLQDAYVEVRPSSKLRVRVGKLKAPFGLERLQAATALAFVERALPSSLAPNRDVGAQVHGELASGVVAYAAGIFNGAPDGGSLDGDDDSGKDVAGRLFVSPFKRGNSALRNLGLGIAGTTGKQAGALPSYRTGGQVPFFTFAPDAVADGTRARVAPQLMFHHGPFGLMAEYARTRSAVRRSLEKSASDIVVEAWQATASWTLTGEPASYTGVRPGRPYDPAKGHWGALELVARVNGFQAGDLAFKLGLADPALSARKARAWGAGLNWHLTRNVKQSAFYERTSFTGGAAEGSDRPAENALFIRAQIAF